MVASPSPFPGTSEQPASEPANVAYAADVAKVTVVGDSVESAREKQQLRRLRLLQMQQQRDSLGGTAEDTTITAITGSGHSGGNGNGRVEHIAKRQVGNQAIVAADIRAHRAAFTPSASASAFANPQLPTDPPPKDPTMYRALVGQVKKPGWHGTLQ